ncbi:MAG TPA: endonuclease III [Phycisphaerae bacterium]|nr:endonuclease III [Phycisphaerae bacterium]HPS53043.1 endonuclease III [Phycisphaerae bacterium]
MPAESSENMKKRADKVFAELKKLYPDAGCSLKHVSPLELLVATILSAQCTDERVNIVTADLFKKYRTARDYACAKQEELENDIRSTGFYRNKAKNIRAAAALLVSDFGGKVPQTMEELLRLPGVARKTANVVLGNAFGINSGFVVDTHVKRLTGRLGFTKHTDPIKIEQDMMTLTPQKDWAIDAHLLIYHGRNYCMARNPNCRQCPLGIKKLCPSADMAK